jgi:hypothetical protein
VGLWFYIPVLEAQQEELGSRSDGKRITVFRCYQEEVAFPVIEMVVIGELLPGALSNIDEGKIIIVVGGSRKPVHPLVLNLKRLV